MLELFEGVSTLETLNPKPSAERAVWKVLGPTDSGVDLAAGNASR